MSIVTRTGDKGETGLFGGQRISKHHIRIHAYGTVDELNAVLGMLLSTNQLSPMLHAQVLRTQNVLFRLGADLATPRQNNAAHVPRIEPEHVQEVEQWITSYEQSLPMPEYFVLPGGSHAASIFHLARTVCRRAERWAVGLREQEDIGAQAVMYLNRLSDYLFLAALKANDEHGADNVKVSYE